MRTLSSLYHAVEVVVRDKGVVLTCRDLRTCNFNNLGYWILFRELGWVEVLALQTPLTLLLIAAEARSSRYHGLFWRKLNPELEASRSKG